MFGISEYPDRVKDEIDRTETVWRDIFAKPDSFFVISWNGSKADGIGMGRLREKGWSLGQGYVRPDSRGRDIGTKMFAVRLNEILKRGGTSVYMSVDATNQASIRVAEKFGFKKIEGSEDEDGYDMGIKNVRDPKVVKKINEVLNGA